MMKQLVISCSLSPTSLSALLAKDLTRGLQQLGNETELIDLRDIPLPFCDGGAAYNDANVKLVAEKIKQATAVTLAVPIYNYEVGGATRNLIAMTGKEAWSGKIVGFLAAAGGERSYMAVMGLANSLMLDFRCVIVPRYVYTTKHAFENDSLQDEGVKERLAGLTQDLHQFAQVLGPIVHV